MASRPWWFGIALSALMAMAASSVSWAAHEIIDSLSARALLADRVAQSVVELKEHNERLKQLEVAFARQAAARETTARVLERLERKIDKVQP